MQKANYGLLMSALLFYNKHVADLEGNGFVINPYDPCVVNKMVNRMDIQPPGTNLYFKYKFVPATPATAVGKT
jgi:hypothetical protein